MMSDQMSGSWDGTYDHGSKSDDSHHFERLYAEPMYDAFVCPLTKQVMRDPVTLENGQTFEREAIEKWFKECKESGKKPVCPLTLKELRSTDLNPSIALRNTIEEWAARNEAAQLDVARRLLSQGGAENDILQALKYIQQICQNSRSSKHTIRNAHLIPMIVDMLKNSSRTVRCKALETLHIVAEDDDDNKEVMAEGDMVRSIVKFLTHEHSKEREEAVSLLYELSKSEALSEKIGSVNGAILILVGMASSNSENVLSIEKADKTLENLESCEKNVQQMAECGRLQPLLRLILEGPPETKLSMASYLGELVLSNDVKVLVARSVGSSLINVMRSGNMQSREAALKALNQISSCEASSRLLLEAGILPSLVKDLFTVGNNQLPMRLKEVSATILANLVNNSGYDFETIPLGPDNQTLVSEHVVHNLLHLISNTGPAIGSKLLQVLVGLTTSPTTVLDVVSSIKSSGATISLIQFIEAPQLDLRMASIKLLQNLSPHMGQELADSLRGTAGQLGSLIRVVSEDMGTEEQAAAIGLLADLPERDLGLTRLMLDEGVFHMVIPRIRKIRQGGDIRGSRFVTPYLEGLTRVLSRVTFALADESAALALCREENVAALFIELLQANGLDKIQMVSAMALENLSQESKNLTRFPELASPGFCGSFFHCFSKPPVITGLCCVHGGTCSIKETFCLLEGQAVGKLVSLLDHRNENVVEASLAALSTLIDDGVDIERGVTVLWDAEAIKPIIDVLLEKRTENLRRRAVWAMERILRTEDIAYEISGDQNVSANVSMALVDAFRNSDYRTRQIAERALKHIDKIPKFSEVFPNTR